MNLVDVVLLLALVLLANVFWQWRQQAERANAYALRYCQQHQLQLLDVYRSGGKLSWKKSAVGWQAQFSFSFSSDGESRYEGDLWLFNHKLQHIAVPPYRLPEAED